jgi:anti-sigma factor (TIGR02949 family)
MNDCSRVIEVLDVYVDDETTPETNAMVQQHLEQCRSCAARLDAERAWRASLRSALRQDRAPAALHMQVRAMLPAPSRFAALVRTWVVPAAAAAIVTWMVLPWRPAEPRGESASAMGEHVACALEGTLPARGAEYYWSRDADTSMPVVPDGGGRIRVVDAHTCGQQRDYRHVIVEEGGTRASVLIAAAGAGGERRLPTLRRGNLEVSGVRASGYRAFVVIDRSGSRALREWREPALQRVRQFLRQQEGS